MKILVSMVALLSSVRFVQAQINPGSNGSDGALNPASSVTINMADHPTGVYQYTHVNIPTDVTVSFIPNANNTPVYWLVQNSVTINGNVDVSGQTTLGSFAPGGLGGPGGYKGGNGANGNSPATAGQGPGGGAAGSPNGGSGIYNYGNDFLIPLLGGSGGAGGNGNNGSGSGGGGGGGAILIAASGSISIDGSIASNGGTPGNWAGYGSGGAIRLVTSQIIGHGSIVAAGWAGEPGTDGRIRFDTYDNEFAGNIGGQFSSGMQPIIIPTAGQLPQLTVTSVGGVPVSASPTGALSTPDAILSAQQNNPIPVVVNCVNLPLHSLITLTVKPMNGSAVSATGYNDTGSTASSTATLSLNIPRGGGLIYATAVTSN